jgi:DNA polymerase-3 subunit delta'
MKQTVIGHERIISMLATMLESGKALPHAFLFHGPDGVGKRTVANEFGRGILCENRQFGGCGVCGPCEEWERFGHARDFLAVSPNEAGVIPIETARSIGTFLSRTPGVASGKVVVIDEADRLTEEAQNSLLKTLEEPPADSVLILVSAKPGRLYQTIRSRMFAVRFSLVPDDAMAGIPADIRACASGRPGNAKRLMQDAEFTTRLVKTLKRAEAVVSGDAAEKLLFAQELAEDPKMLDACMGYWLDTFHRMLQEAAHEPRRIAIGRNARTALTASFLLEDTELQPRLLVENMLLAFV